jgi:peptide/nickel transport system substrate-binding protein/microcin C transport system substrate-binding protein
MKILICSLFLSFNVFASLGNPNAVQGGTFFYNLAQEPVSLHPVEYSDAYALEVFPYIVENLLLRNQDTFVWEPYLAESYKISKDGLTYEFKLREGLTWSDGKPVTAEDIKFSLDAIRDPKHKALTLIPYFENFKSPEIIDARTIKFVSSRKYYKNLEVLATLNIIPKHIYADTNTARAKELNRTIIASGPYTFEKLERGSKLTLKKNTNWWGKNLPIMKGRYNFDKIVMRFVKDDTIALEMLKKGELDYNEFASPEAFVKKTVGPEWGTKVFKVQAENLVPRSYSFIGWNLEDKIFRDKDVRIAMAHLMNREEMIKKFLFGLSMAVTGPEYPTSVYASPKVKPILYDPKMSLAILRKIGWSDTDGDQILDKMIDGKKVPLKFTINEPLQDFMKFLTIFKEDAKKIGVEVEIKFVEWNTFIKLLDEKKFQAARLAWGGVFESDPKQIWHSSSAVPGGSNFVQYKNPTVDKMIEEARETIDDQKRKEKMHAIFETIAADAPYLFLFARKHSLYAHTARVKKVKETYKYDIGGSYWWMQK